MAAANAEIALSLGLNRAAFFSALRGQFFR
jgi:hypothetical protein